MPHITRGVGPTNEADYPVAVTIHTSRAHLIFDTAEPVTAPTAEPAPAAGGQSGKEDSWAPGGSSTTSTSPLDNSKSSGAATPFLPAPTTASLSLKAPTGSGSAGSTGGGKPSDANPTED